MSGAAADLLGMQREIFVAVVIFLAVASVAFCGLLSRSFVLSVAVVLVAACVLSVIYMDAIQPGWERAL